jgi:hypothetical protein
MSDTNKVNVVEAAKIEQAERQAADKAHAEAQAALLQRIEEQSYTLESNALQPTLKLALDCERYINDALAHGGTAAFGGKSGAYTALGNVLARTGDTFGATRYLQLAGLYRISGDGKEADKLILCKGASRSKIKPILALLTREQWNDETEPVLAYSWTEKAKKKGLELLAKYGTMTVVQIQDACTKIKGKAGGRGLSVKGLAKKFAAIWKDEKMSVDDRKAALSELAKALKKVMREAGLIGEKQPAAAAK